MEQISVNEDPGLKVPLIEIAPEISQLHAVRPVKRRPLLTWGLGASAVLLSAALWIGWRDRRA